MSVVGKGLKILREEIQGSICNIDNIYNALDFTFAFQAFGVSIKPVQVEYEIAKLLVGDLWGV
jgi:hypothetical protein